MYANGNLCMLHAYILGINMHMYGAWMHENTQTHACTFTHTHERTHAHMHACTHTLTCKTHTLACPFPRKGYSKQTDIWWSLPNGTVNKTHKPPLASLFTCNITLVTPWGTHWFSGSLLLFAAAVNWGRGTSVSKHIKQKLVRRAFSSVHFSHGK